MVTKTSNRERLQMEFFLKAPMNSHPERLTRKWDAYEMVKFRGFNQKEAAQELRVVPTTVSNAIRDVSEALESELIDPSNEAIERKRCIYFDYVKKRGGDIKQIQSLTP